MAAELRADVSSTEQYIVGRAREAIQILKECKDEAQRQHYEIVCTALAPERVPECDPRGMARKTAKLLRINRKGAE